MTEKLQVYKCEICGNIVEVLHAGKGQLVCCDQPMKLLEDKTKEQGYVRTTDIKALKELYSFKREEILSRLAEFRKVGISGDGNRIFTELCFCILTPQSKAKNCWEAVSNLSRKNLLVKGNIKQISKLLDKVRFKNTKTKNIILARKTFSKNGTICIKSLLKRCKNIFELRHWLVKNVKGIGLKESSHFLRNIGLGKNIAILDRHILKNLVNYGVIKEIPSRKRYLDIETKMIRFAEKIDIPISHLDLLFWSKETGKVFK